MLCDDCKAKEATYHSIKKVNGLTNEKHLCQDCYKKQNSAASSNNLGEIGEFFSGFKNLFEYPHPKRSVLKCFTCGTTADEFLETGYVGCSQCYKNLQQVVLPVIQKMQNDTRHTGKNPSGEVIDTAKSEEIERVKRELARAVEVEDFERAEELSQKLRALKS